MNQRYKEEFVTCVRAAELMDVSVSTVKRLCDQQTLDCVRTSGGHRRISMQSIARWSVLQKAEDSAELPVHHDYSLSDIELTLERLLSGAMNELTSFLDYLKTQRWTIPRILDDVLLAALRNCHLLCDAESSPQYLANQCVSAIRDLIGYLMLHHHVIAADAPVAVGGCVGPARHDLHSGAIALGLRTIGYRAISIGSRVEPEDLVAAGLRHGASIVWMNCSHVADADEIQRLACDLSGGLSASQLMLLTGSGSSGRLNRRLLPCDLASDSIVELTDFVAHRTFRNAKSIVGEATNFRAA